MRVVLDTNVLVAAMRSPHGASGALVRAARRGALTMVASPPLFLEYEAVMKRPQILAAASLSSHDVDALLDVLASVLVPAVSTPSMRPLLSDPDDDMVLEAAIDCAAELIATFEVKTFAVVGKAFGIQVLTPALVWRKVMP